MAGPTLGAFLQDNLMNGLRFSLNGVVRAVLLAGPAAIALLWVDHKLEKRLADTRRAGLVPNMGLVFVTEIPDGAQDRIRC